ncbi:small wing phospholipase C gamma 1 isoform X2 [Brevipalpus obovatus]|uniref:small wing phospholipase C gamma 1 isoform X2 n=1 Tax=Brevipalpus obovatus TaxID=246614 RepID=UPI003D9DB48B
MSLRNGHFFKIGSFKSQKSRSLRAKARECFTEQEVEAIFERLEKGTVMMRFHPKLKPEKQFMKVNRKTRELTWYRVVDSQNILEDTIELAHIQEVRMGPCSKAFDRWLENSRNSRKLDKRQCLIILYGLRFRLKSLSCRFEDKNECEQWHFGLFSLVKEAKSLTYHQAIEAWLLREFSIASERGFLIMKDLKPFLSKVCCKISNESLKQHFNRADSRGQGELQFEAFQNFYYNLIDQGNIFDEYLSEYSSDRKRIGVKEFTRFLNQSSIEHDHCSRRHDENSAIEIMKQFIPKHKDRTDSEPYLLIHEFMVYLFSEHNQVWDSRYDKVTQDMDRPLSHYWIASSHNTYLTGDQIRSESSTDAYARALRMGCRCIELDCWDGYDGTPIIYHGHTITTKIKFIDALKVINEHAFVTSEYPVILSIENHCSLEQQRKMANNFKEILKDQLLTQPLNRNETELPSPSQLRRKFILKHKKLFDRCENLLTQKDSNESNQELDMGSTIKSGILYLLDDSDERCWKPHLFMLTSTKIFYTECRQAHIDEDENEDRPLHLKENESLPLPDDELHFGEKWFHGKLEGGRTEASRLLMKNADLGDGTYLVRESDTFVGDYSLSFLRDGKVKHCRIRSRQENGQTRYSLVDGISFDSLFSLITHYQTHPLRSQDISVFLLHPVPQFNAHESEEWYHPSMDRPTAENHLRTFNIEGAFLVRPSENQENSLCISFRAKNSIKHCRIRQEGRLYILGHARFQSLKALIEWYRVHPLYKATKLRFSISNKDLKTNTQKNSDSDCSLYIESSYLDVGNCNSGITVRAIFNYCAQKNDELSFTKGTVITNVVKHDNGWWKGDHGESTNRWFPANLVEEIDTGEKSPDLVCLIYENFELKLISMWSIQNELGSSESPQKGFLDIFQCSVDLPNAVIKGKESVFLVTSTSRDNPIEVAVPNREEMNDWVKQIRDAAQLAHEKICQSKELEKKQRIAKELSNMTVYCQAVPFIADRIGNFTEMSSFPESKIEKWMSPQNYKFFLKYHRNQLSRVYPGIRRLDSSNFDPIRMWAAGIQMVALNYQTPDRAMQLNQGKFMENGGCGYLLRPDFMFDESNSFSVHDKNSLTQSEAITLTVRVIAGRHLTKNGRSTVSPFVEIEIAGLEMDNSKCRTRTVHDDGLSPCWEETFVFEIACPDLAMIRFVAYDEDVFGDPNFLGQASYSVQCLRQGYRSVPLKTEFSEKLGLSSLLIRLERGKM